MNDVLRYDTSELRTDKAQRLANGWMRVDAVIGRTGVFEYQDAAGKVTREYRPPEEVERADSVDSFSLVPMTNDHPPMRLDAANTRAYAVGSVGKPKAKGGKVVAPLLITDAATLTDIEQGKRQLSPGYTVTLDRTPGTTPDGQRYDAVQRNIRANHVALVRLGRQGSEVALRMDGAAVEIHTEQPEMKTIKIDGKEFQVEDAVAAAFSKLSAKDKDSDKSDSKGSEGGQPEPKPDPEQKQKDDSADVPPAVAARLDALEEENRRLREDGEKKNDRIDARVELLATARSVIPNFRADGMSDTDVQAAVILALDPDAKAKLEARKDSPEYIRARYEIALENRIDSGTRLLQLGLQAARHDQSGEPTGAMKAKAEAEKERADAWKGDPDKPAA